MSGEGFGQSRDGSGEWRHREQQQAAPPGQRNQTPTFLSRLRKVLSGVRGSGAKKTEVRHSSRPNEANAVESETQAGLLDAGDRKVYQHAISQLHASQPLALRLSVLEELCELCREYDFEDLPAIWAMSRDLLSPTKDRVCKEKAVAFIGALSAGENFNRLGLIRLEMFSIVQDGGTSLGLQLQLKALMYITKNAQSCTPLELEVCDLLVSWLEKLAQDIQSVKGHLTPRNSHKDLLQYTAGFFKFCSAGLPEANIQQLTGAVCEVLEGSVHKEEPAEGSDAWTLHRGCLAALDVLVRYTVPPLRCITRAVDTLCLVVNEASFSRESWLVLKNILTGDHFLGAFNHLIDMLHAPGRDDASPEPDDDGARQQLRGAVFVVSMASWGSSRIESMQYPRQSILAALLCAVASGERAICYEVLLSVRRLLTKFGPQLRFEWGTVFPILERICLALDIIHPPAPARPKPAPTSGHALAPRTSTEDPTSRAAAPGPGSKGEGEGEGAGPEEQALWDVLALVDEQHSRLKFQGLEADYYRVVTKVKGHVPDRVALAALAYYAERVHPAHAEWLAALRELMEGFYAAHCAAAVRVAALKVLREVLESYGLMYEQEITDTAVLPSFHALPQEPDRRVWEAALGLLVGLAMRMQGDRFEAVLQLLEGAATEGAEEALRLAAVQGLLSLLPATMRHLPTSRFTSLWGVLLGMVERAGKGSTQAKVEILQHITCMSVTSRYRPRLVKPGKEDVVCPIPIVAHGGGGAAGGEGEQREAALDTGRLFAALVRIAEGEQEQAVFAVAVEGLVKGLQNRFIFEQEDIASLASLLTLRLRACTWGPRPPAPDSAAAPPPSGDRAAAAATRNANYEAGLKLLGLAVGGWMSELPPALLSEALDTFIRGLTSEHNAPPGEPCAPLSGQPVDKPALLRAMKRNGGVASVCINNLALLAVLLPDSTNRHLPRVLDVLDALAEEVEQAQLVLHGVQYTKYIAGQLPHVSEGVSVAMQERALRVLFRFMNKPKWGGLVANLTHRALALWYLHAGHALRENFVSTVDQCMRENEGMKRDPLGAIMLDWLMRNASADIQTSSSSRDWMEPIFRRPGVKCKAFAFGDSILSIRSTPLGLVDMASRRPTDMKRWIIYRPLPTHAGKNLKPSIDGILQLLSSSLEVSQVSDVKIDYDDPPSSPLALAPAPGHSAEDRGASPGGAPAAPHPVPLPASTPAPDAPPHLPAPAADAASTQAPPEAGSPAARSAGASAVQGQREGGRAAGDATAGARPEGQSGPGGGKGVGGRGVVVTSEEEAAAAIAEAAAVEQLQHEIPAVDPYVMLMQWLRGPFGDMEVAHNPTELRFDAALERAIRLLDRTPLTFTHKFGILYIAPDQRSESEFMKNLGGSALYESFVRKLGIYMPLADCSDDVFTGGLDKSPQKRDGEIALFWRNSLAQCIFFVGTLMPNEAGEQVNKKRFIGNTYVKVVYTDSDHWFTLSWLSGQFNLIVIVVAPLAAGYFRLTVLRDPSVPVIGPVTDVVVVPDHAVATVVRRMLIDADVATMIAAAGEEHYSSNWQERLKQIRLMLERHAIVTEQPRDE